jgi:hypothetical protein
VNARDFATVLANRAGQVAVSAISESTANRPDWSAWMLRQDAAPSLTAVLRTALKEFPAHRGFATPSAKLHITPSRKGSGWHDVSIAHDRYLAGK